MTARADAERGRVALRLGLAAVFAAAFAFAAVMRDAASREIETVDGLVAPTWSDEFAEASVVRIQTAEGTLTLERSAGAWTLAERDGHPVAASALTTLHRALTTLRFAGARTADPANHERLGVVAPGDGGDGVRLTLEDGAGAALVDLIVGASRSGGFFVRRPGESEAFAVDGALPDIAAPSFWVDLDVLPIARADIREVVITPGGGGLPYRLVRASPQAADFDLGEPSDGWSLITAGAANGPGGALAELRFVDVAPAAEHPASVRAQHTAHTFDGLVITLAQLGGVDPSWARVRASVEADASDAARAAADAINARTDGWVYQLPEYAPERLTRQLDRIARSARDSLRGAEE